MLILFQYIMSTTTAIFRVPHNSWRGFVSSATRVTGKITGMKASIESLTRKTGDEILDKKLGKMFDS